MLYALIVAVLSITGGAVPLSLRPQHAQLQIYLSLAAGALLGAALFHLLPESAEQIHASFGVPTVLGIALIFFVQRYVAPHSHEPWDRIRAGGDLPDADDLAHRLNHDHTSEPGPPQETPGRNDHTGHGPPRQRLLSGLVAVAALSVHSFFDGVAIGAATTGTDDAGGLLAVGVFLSVLIHKPLDGLSVSVLLVNSGARARALWTVQAAYAALVPVGTAAFLLTKGAVADPTPLVGYTLAFSAGTFLAIALTDLLPELHFHSHDRNKLSAALLIGLLVMWITSVIGHSSHEHTAKHANVSVAPAQRVDSSRGLSGICFPCSIPAPTAGGHQRSEIAVDTCLWVEPTLGPGFGGTLRRTETSIQIMTGTTNETVGSSEKTLSTRVKTARQNGLG